MSLIFDLSAPKASPATHRHQRLGDAGQHGGPQRVDQDLVLRHGEHQQGDGVLRAEVLQQHGEPPAATGTRTRS